MDKVFCQVSVVRLRSIIDNKPRLQGYKNGFYIRSKIFDALNLAPAVKDSVFAVGHKQAGSVGVVPQIGFGGLIALQRFRKVLPRYGSFHD